MQSRLNRCPIPDGGGRQRGGVLQVLQNRDLHGLWSDREEAAADRAACCCEGGARLDRAAAAGPSGGEEQEVEHVPQ